MPLFVFAMSLSPMLHVDFDKWPCHPVIFKCQYPLIARHFVYTALGVGTEVVPYLLSLSIQTYYSTITNGSMHTIQGGISDTRGL